MKLLRLFFLVLFPLTSIAQPYGNEWINYNQQYLKIPVHATGMYQIDQSTLLNALSNIGVSLSGIDARNIQLFSKGKEVPIEIIGEADGSFDVNDKLIFYGEKNDGWFDRNLYQQPGSSRINPFYSLFSDTSYYFLTWNNLTANARYRASGNTNFTAKTFQTYFFAQSIVAHSYQYSYGEKDVSGVSAPLYHESEGYVFISISNPSTRTVNVLTRNILKTGTAPPTLFKTTFAGASNSGSAPNHRLEVKVAGTQVLDTSFSGYELHEKTTYLSTSTLHSTTQRVEYKNLPLNPAPATDFINTGYVLFEYPHSRTLSGETHIEILVPASTDTLYYSLLNYQYGSVPFVYDVELGLKCKTVQSGNDIQVLIPPGPKRKCILTSPSRFKNPSALKPVSNIANNRGFFTDYSRFVPDNAFLLISHPSLWSAANQYANYKNQKGFNAYLVSAEDLYDQFAYGIYQHSLALRNYVDYISSEKATAPPTFLFLLGKSVKTISTRKSVANKSLNLVPTIGTPPADNLFTTDLEGKSVTPSIPVGRLAASNSTQLLNYLEKVKTHELELGKSSLKIDDEIWKKTGIHFVGGVNDFEQRVFTQYLERYQDSYESPKMNGKIYTYARSSTGASGGIEFDSVNTLLNTGVSILTFFGHGSGGQLGINLSDPKDYSNTGKYPLFIANSCNVGDYHLPSNTASSVNEKWILEKNKGAIGFISSTSIGYPSNLNRFSSGIYNALSNDLYGKSIGEIMQSASGKMNATNKLDARTALEMNLHGDPSLILNEISKADFAVEKSYISAPEIVSADQAQFEIKVPVFNLGMGTDSLIKATLLWRFPNGRDTLYNVEFRDNAVTHTLTFNLPIDDNNHIGENTFTIHVNPDLRVDETYPTQNNIVAGIRVNISSDDLIPIWPKNFAIVPSKNVKLVGNTADLFAPEREYLFELDIKSTFNSPMKKSTTIRSKGGVIVWDPNIDHAPDSIVYYWRCSPKKTNPQDLKWRTSSFQIIPGKEGWSQYDFDQFRSNQITGLEFQKTANKLEFINGSVAISGNIISRANVKWSIDGDVIPRVGVCQGRPSILITVIDPNTLKPWETRYFDRTVSPPIEYNANRNYGNYNDPSRSPCPEQDSKFMFRVQDATEMDAMVNFVQNQVPDSFYLLIMNGNYGYFRDSSLWKPRHYQLFTALGSDSIRTIASNNPLILFTQKGNPNRTIEVTGNDPNGSISLTANISAKFNKGQMQSVQIGPAKNWKHLSWSHSTNSTNDSMYLTVSGIDRNGINNTLEGFFGFEKEVENIPFDFASFNKYHYLQLRGDYSDKTNSTAPSLNKWQLYHDEVPEFAIDPGKLFEFHNDSVHQGEPVTLQSQVVNASRINAKNIRIRAYLRGKRNDIVELPIRTIAELNAWQEKPDSLVVNTEKLSGLYTLSVELNPLDSNWQPEAQHFNNLIQKSFFVKADNLNPLLDVTFDGIHILDGDIVSARPEIRMSLNDENQFLPLEDTSHFEVYLTDPNKVERRIYFVENGKEQLLFEPGNSKKNKATIQYNPMLTTDGVYKLSVNATDGSGNRSGGKNYEISFEVINRSTITHVMNYPNPFTTRTQFVFTLTGYKIPDLIRIQILTISGRVIREIDKHELGHLHIGRNITEYAWDGRDEFGDRLANGVYFYRVITKIEGENIEHRESGADSYFKKEFGKMYLMR